MMSDTIALYLRLSQEDEIKGESVSIGGQRNLLHDYIKTHQELDGRRISEFLDDGYSGTNFNRPGVQEMLGKVKNGEISCIIVKDLSRFGRSYIEVGNYLERVFPFLGVRFIAVNDNYDSNNHKGSTGDIDIPFRNLLYDLYSKDISQKVKSGKKAKMKRGDFIAPYALYGYKKSNENKNKLVIDETAAQVVQKIFALTIEGEKTSDIARRLNEEKILTPMSYKKQLGISRRFNNGSAQSVWTKDAVLRVIHDERYTGKIIGGKQKVEVVGSHKAVKVPQDEWVVVEGMHDSIVTDEVFKAANEMIISVPKRLSGTSENRLFSKKIRCGYCNLLFRRKEALNSYYYCGTARVADGDCFNGKLFEDELAKKILCILQKQSKIVVTLAKINCTRQSELQATLKVKEQQFKRMISNNDKSDIDKFALYEKYKKGKISKEAYLLRKEQFAVSENQRKQKADSLKSEIEECTRASNANMTFVERFQNKEYIEKLSRGLVNDLVKNIYVYSSGSIEVTFSCQDPLSKSIAI